MLPTTAPLSCRRNGPASAAAGTLASAPAPTTLSTSRRERDWPMSAAFLEELGRAGRRGALLISAFTAESCSAPGMVRRVVFDLSFSARAALARAHPLPGRPER